MKLNLSYFITKHFPARQILIRQEGEVKVVELTTKKQCVMALSAFVCIASLASFGAYNFWQQNRLQLSSGDVVAENQQLRQQIAEAQQQQEQFIAKLSRLEQRQQLTQNVLASLPASLMPQQGIPFEASDTQSASENVDERLATLQQRQYDTFSLLDQAIAKREQLLGAAIARAGLPSTVMDELVAKSEEQVAQGGPLELLDTDEQDTESLSVVDKLLTLNQLESMLAQVPHMLPAADYYISSSFGLRKDPMNGRRAMHKGVDLAAWRNTEIFAPADGTVVRAGRNGGYGRFIEIEHANGFTTRFGHLNKIHVKRGDLVTKGEVIALMGSTGRSTATHLHYEVLHNNKHINPVKITKALTDVFKEQRYTEE
ncbi:M23 family metallopeptidase [Pseudoalteromonas sp. T1lg75]|uniref:M23 family metallopeptidase n=1 Tax=Pseudoalteromonas sp. T1lg75 TaxID=2077102 RepID=UPI000CF737EF|nr:M23 family metallopeptidase [Pseudoalteromonas sp. T1lg75]